MSSDFWAQDFKDTKCLSTALSFPLSQPHRLQQQAQTPGIRAARALMGIPGMGQEIQLKAGLERGAEPPALTEQCRSPARMVLGSPLTAHSRGFCTELPLPSTLHLGRLAWGQGSVEWGRCLLCWDGAHQLALLSCGTPVHRGACGARIRASPPLWLCREPGSLLPSLASFAFAFSAILLMRRKAQPAGWRAEPPPPPR